METELLKDGREMTLLKRAKAGDFEAFQSIIQDLQPRVYGLAMRIVKQSEDAEDVMQQTFLSLIEHIEGFREESSLATWVLRIASNHALKILRKKRGLSITAYSQLDSNDQYSEIPHPEFIAPWVETADAILQRRETKEALDKAIDSLDDKYRLVFLLRDVEGFSVRETAEALELTESTVKVRLLRARLALREELTREYGDPNLVMTKDHRHD